MGNGADAPWGAPESAWPAESPAEPKQGGAGCTEVSGAPSLWPGPVVADGEVHIFFQMLTSFFPVYKITQFK